MDVRILATVVPVQVIDAERRLVRCPSPGCGDTAHIEDDGRIACPTGDWITRFLADAVATYERLGFLDA